MKKTRSNQQRNQPPVEPHPQRDDGRDFEMVRKHKERFDAKRWEEAMEFKRQMPRPPTGTQDPGPAALQKLKAKDVGMFLGSDNHKADVRAARNPQKHGSYGFVGTFATVLAKTRSIDGTLVLRFSEKKLGLVNRESLRLFRWDEKAGEFLKVSGSGVGLEGDYVYGRISRPGQYSIIGVNTHPTVFQTVKAFHGMGGLLEALPPNLVGPIRDRLCKVLLCDSGVSRALRDRRLFSELARASAIEGFPLPSGDLGDLPRDSVLCDFCFGGSDRIPPAEGQIMQEMDPGCWDGGWESSGPANISGCIRQVMLDPSNSNRLYAAADDGGIWVLNRIDYYPLADGWRPLTDRQPDLRVSAMAVAPSDGHTIYYADRLGYFYKSMDQGESWQRTSPVTINARKILIHPEDPLTVLAATTSGLRLSGDGGASWPFVWRPGEDVLDVAMDPQDSSIIYIAVRNVGVLKNYALGFGRWVTVLPWSARHPDPHGGTTMIKIALGYRNADGSLQTDANRRIVVKLGREIWLNDTGGRGSWVSKGRLMWTNGDWEDTGQGDWDHCVAIDPFDPSVILVGQIQLYRSSNGGDTWGSGPVVGFNIVHEDQQSIEFDRRHRNVVYLSNDGGVFRSTDGGATWTNPRTSGVGDISYISDEVAARRNLNLGLVTAQFFRVGVHGNYAVGNAYHLGVIASPNLSLRKWRPLQGGNYEFAQVHADPKRPNRYYVFQAKLDRQRYPLSARLEPNGRDFFEYSDFEPYSENAVVPIGVDTRPGSQTIVVSALDSPAPGLGYWLAVTRDGDVEPWQDPNPPNEILNKPTWHPALFTRGDPVVSVVFAESTPGKAYAITRGGQVFTREDVNSRGEWYPPAGHWLAGGVRPTRGGSRKRSTDLRYQRRTIRTVDRWRRNLVGQCPHRFPTTRRRSAAPGIQFNRDSSS